MQSAWGILYCHLWSIRLFSTFPHYLTNGTNFRRGLKQKKQSHYKPGQAQRVPGGWGSQSSRQSAHEGGKVVSPTHRPCLPPGNIPGTHFCWRLSRPQDHRAAGRIMSMKNFNDTIGNRTRDLPACSAVRRGLSDTKYALIFSTIFV